MRWTRWVRFWALSHLVIFILFCAESQGTGGTRCMSFWNSFSLLSMISSFYICWDSHSCDSSSQNYYYHCWLQLNYPSIFCYACLRISLIYQYHLIHAGNICRSPHRYSLNIAFACCSHYRISASTAGDSGLVFFSTSVTLFYHE